MRLVLKVNNKDKRRQWRRSSVFIVNFEHISHLQLPGSLTGSNTSLCIVFEHLSAGFKEDYEVRKDSLPYLFG